MIREIYGIREITGLPMTVIVDQAIREYLGNYETEGDQESQPDNLNIYGRNS